MPLNEQNWIPHTHSHTCKHTETNWYNCKQFFFPDLVCNLSFRAHFNANLNLNFCYRKVNKTKLREQAKKHSVERGRGNAEWAERKQVNRAKEKKLAILLNSSGARAKPVYDTKCHKGHGKVGRKHKRNAPLPVSSPLAMGMLMWNGTEDSRKWKQRMWQRGRWNLVVSR